MRVRAELLRDGGRIVRQGKVSALVAAHSTLTGEYLAANLC